MKITPCEVANILQLKRVPYGKNYGFPVEIETSECENFFGERCPCNVHVVGKNTAHRDRVDPRKDILGHLEEDVGVPAKGALGVAVVLLGIWLLSRLAQPR